MTGMSRLLHANDENIRPTKTFCGKDILEFNSEAEASVSIPKLGPLDRREITCRDCRRFVDEQWPYDLHGSIHPVPRSNLPD